MRQIKHHIIIADLDLKTIQYYNNSGNKRVNDKMPQRGGDEGVCVYLFHSDTASRYWTLSGGNKNESEWKTGDRDQLGASRPR